VSPTEAQAPILRRPIPPELRRRTRIVAALRLILPAMVALLLAGLALWSRFGFDASSLHFAIDSIKLGAIDPLVMTNPHFEGIDEKKQPFSVTASSASEANSKADVVDLVGPQADITLQSGAWLTMTADTGRYYRQAQKLDLLGAVNLFHDQGYELHTRNLHIDLAANRATTNTPVDGHGPSGDLKADGLDVSDGGKRVVLLGHAQVQFYDPAQLSAMVPKP